MNCRSLENIGHCIPCPDEVLEPRSPTLNRGAENRRGACALILSRVMPPTINRRSPCRALRGHASLPNIFGPLRSILAGTAQLAGCYRFPSR